MRNELFIQATFISINFLQKTDIDQFFIGLYLQENREEVCKNLSDYIVDSLSINK